jgi:hypothetical protein
VGAAAALMWAASRALSGRARQSLLVVGTGAVLLAIPAVRQTIQHLIHATLTTGAERNSTEARLALLNLVKDPHQFSLAGMGPNQGVTARTGVTSVDSEYLLLYLGNGLLPALTFALAGIVAVGNALRRGFDAVDTAWRVAAAALMLGLISVALITQLHEFAFMVLGMAGAARSADVAEHARKRPLVGGDHGPSAPPRFDLARGAIDHAVVDATR